MPQGQEAASVDDSTTPDESIAEKNIDKITVDCSTCTCIQCGKIYRTMKALALHLKVMHEKTTAVNGTLDACQASDASSASVDGTLDACRALDAKGDAIVGESAIQQESIPLESRVNSGPKT